MESVLFQFWVTFASKLNKQTKSEDMINHLAEGPIEPKHVTRVLQIFLHQTAEAKCIVDEMLKNGFMQKIESPTEWCCLTYFFTKNAEHKNCLFED